MSFSDLLDRFEDESSLLDLKQKVERLQFEVDFWTNAETSATSKITRGSCQRRSASAKDSLHQAREQYRQRSG